MIEEQVKRKPCRFCGKYAIAFDANAIGKYFYFCWYCGAQGPTCDTVEEAAEKWNAPGPVEDELRSKIVELQSTITACEHEVAQVYCAITNGRFSKMNTDAAYILHEVEQLRKRDTDERITELEARLRPIPVSERLPEAHPDMPHTSVDVLARDESGWQKAFCMMEDYTSVYGVTTKKGDWFGAESHGSFGFFHPTHWLPLPQFDQDGEE